MLLFTKKRKGYTPQEQVYFCDDLWNNILSYNTCPGCNKCIEKKEVFDIKSKIWTWIKNQFFNFELTPIPEPKIYKEVYKTNFELCKRGFVWDQWGVDFYHNNQQGIFCDDCNPIKKIKKILQEEEEERKRRTRRKRNTKRRRSNVNNKSAYPGHWI